MEEFVERLKGKVALVTGAARRDSIGREIRQLHVEGVEIRFLLAGVKPKFERSA
jgi:NAD(P)-dependent dehydrogenase (short-subunit alcohol dehydrogenase family)